MGKNRVNVGSWGFGWGKIGENIENQAFAWWKMMENRGNFWKLFGRGNFLGWGEICFFGNWGFVVRLN